MLRSLAVTESSREGKGSRGTGEGPEGQKRVQRDRRGAQGEVPGSARDTTGAPLSPAVAQDQSLSPRRFLHSWQ